MSEIGSLRGRVFIGTSGWNYPHWQGRFYPKEIKQKEWLEYYCRYFSTVELNATFYRLPSRDVFEGWRRRTPEGFSFAVKASRSFTHIRRLMAPEENLTRLLDNAIGLGDKLGLILFQLPPSMEVELERLKALAVYMERQDIFPKVRSVLEVRNVSWLTSDVYRILKEHNWSLCLSDWHGLSVDGPITADFVYIRRHGPGARYSSSYSEEMLKIDAEMIKGWLKEGRDVYIYFNNDAYGYAVKNAMRLKELVED